MNIKSIRDFGIRDCHSGCHQQSIKEQQQMDYFPVIIVLLQCWLNLDCSGSQTQSPVRLSETEARPSKKASKPETSPRPFRISLET